MQLSTPTDCVADPAQDFRDAITAYLEPGATHYFFDLFGAYPEGYVPEGFVQLIGIGPFEPHAVG